jgi:hypothetical protein
MGFKSIPNHRGYFADTEGNIYSNTYWRRAGRGKEKSLRKLKPWVTNVGTGYLSVAVSLNGKRTKRYVHELVLEAFYGERPKGGIALHGRKGSLCNVIDNLSWGTRDDNRRDMLRDSTLLIGELCSWAKLNRLQVRIIRRLCEDRYLHSLTNRQIAEPFGITSQNVSKVAHRNSWNHVQ